MKNKKFHVWRYETPLYGEGRYNGFVEIECESAKKAAEIVLRFDKKNGDMACYDYQVQLLDSNGQTVNDCGTF